MHGSMTVGIRRLITIEPKSPQEWCVPNRRAATMAPDDCQAEIMAQILYTNPRADANATLRKHP